MNSELIEQALKASQAEFMSLAARLSEPYRTNVHTCAALCRDALASVKDTAVTTPLPTKKPKRKSTSRAARWADACAEANAALDALRGGVEALEGPLSDLQGLKDEFTEWKDNLDGKFEGSALVEKLDEVANLEIEDAASNISDAVDELSNSVSEWEGMDLPRGFGRD